MKKLLSVILVVLLCITACPISTLAADGEFVLSAKGGYALVGGKITVPVVVEKNSGWRALEVRVSYDADVLEIDCPNHNGSAQYCTGENAPSVTKRDKADFAMATKYDCDNLGTSSPRHTANPYIFQWAYPTIEQDITETGTYATITFKVKDTAALGETTVGLYIDIITNCDYEHPTTVTNDATVNVIDEYPAPNGTPAVKGKSQDGTERDIHANDDTTSVSVDSFDPIKNEVYLSFSYDATRDAYGDTVEWYKGDELVATGLTATVPYDTYDANDYRVVVEYENHLGGAGGFENTKNNQNMNLGYIDITNSHPSGNLIGTASTTKWYMHDGLPTGDKWGMYAIETKLASADDYSADYPFVTQNGIFGGQQYSCYSQTSYTSGSTTVTPYKGNAMLRVATSYRSAIKAIENLTPGKMYKISFYAATANTNSAIYYAGVANSVVDINSAQSTQSNTLGHKIISFCFPYDEYTPETLGQWHKQEFLFVATQETEYLHLRVTNPYSFIDELTCQEYVSDNSWDFEDGESLVTYSQINKTDKTNAADVEIVANDTGVSKLGNNYLKLKPKKDYNNTASFNFEYNGTDRYIVSFDMKVMKFAAKTASERLEMFLAKSDGTGYAVTTYNTTNALVPAANQPVVRTLENGKGAYRAMTANKDSAHHLYHVNATSGTFVDPTNQTAKDNVLFEEWTHYEIVIDPVENGYSGYANFSWQVVGAGFEIGIDNIKVQNFSVDSMIELEDNFAPTYAYNIRSASSGYKQGLRFKSSIDLGALGLISADDKEDSNTDNIVGTFANGTKIVEYGTIAATKSSMQNLAATSGLLIRETAKDVASDPAKSSVIAGVAYNKDTGRDIRYKYENGVVTYTGVLIGIYGEDIATDFVVRAYVILEDANGVRTTVYGDIQTLNMYQAADYIVKNSNNDADIAAAQEVIDAYNVANNQ